MEFLHFLQEGRSWMRVHLLRFFLCSSQGICYRKRSGEGSFELKLKVIEKFISYKNWRETKPPPTSFSRLKSSDHNFEITILFSKFEKFNSRELFSMEKFSVGENIHSGVGDFWKQFYTWGIPPQPDKRSEIK